MQCRESECEEDGVMAAEQVSFRSAVPAAKSFSAEESTETLTLSRYEVAEHVLQYFLG